MSGFWRQLVLINYVQLLLSKSLVVGKPNCPESAFVMGGEL